MKEGSNAKRSWWWETARCFRLLEKCWFVRHKNAINGRSHVRVMSWSQRPIRSDLSQYALQQRSWPGGGGSRGPDPPELPSGVHAKRKSRVRIFFVEGGRWLSSHWWWTRPDPSWTFKPAYAAVCSKSPNSFVRKPEYANPWHDEPNADFSAKWSFKVIQGHLFRCPWKATKRLLHVIGLMIVALYVKGWKLRRYSERISENRHFRRPHFHLTNEHQRMSA